MRRFIAHIGARKTGTTAFQMWLRGRRAEMIAANYLPPSVGAGARGNHRGLVDMMTGGKSAGRARQSPRAAFEREAHAHPCHDILISTEILEGGPGLKLAAPLGEAIDRLDARKIAILVVRDPVAYYNSGFAQVRKTMRGKLLDFAAYAEQGMQKGRADWRSKVLIYENAGFEVVVIPYDRAFTELGAPRSILSHSLFGDLATRFDWSAPRIHNPSMGAIGLIIMDRVRAAMIAEAPGSGPEAPLALRELVARQAARCFDDRAFNGMTSALQAKLLDHHAGTNSWIADRYFGRRWDEVLPPPPVPAEPSPRALDELSPRLAVEVAREADRIIEIAREKGWLPGPHRPFRGDP